MIEETEFEPIAMEEGGRKLVSFRNLILSIIFLTFVVGGSLIYYGLFLNAPVMFEGTKVVSIEEGDSVTLITQKLESADVIKSAELLYLILVLNFDTTGIKASRYVFDEPLSTYEVAEQLITGEFTTDLISMTIFEGESREKIANRLKEQFTWFDESLFLSITADLEGKLFPDTYYLPEEYSTEELVNLLHETHNEVIAEYDSEIQSNSLSREDIIILASIVEREANTNESMKLVAGIFMNRLDIGMGLQADATIEYVLEHELNELRPGQLADSLREVDSPYNTYLYPGLPPTAIGNPGRAAIEAVLYPTQSEYLYYLTGTDGEFYYAETYNQHLINIDRHLK